MNVLKYLIILLVLLTAHMLLGSWALVALWTCLGAIVPLWLKQDRWLLPKVWLMELLACIIYWLFFPNRNEQLGQLANNIDLSSAALRGIIIGVNLLTVVLCVSTAFYFTKWITWRKNR
jgi:hypothetical protein